MNKTDLLFEDLWGHLVVLLEDVGNKLHNRTEPTAEERESYDVLRRHLTSGESRRAMESVVHGTCYDMIQSMLLMLDGATMLASHVSVGLVDMETNEDLSPSSGTYRSEFAEYVRRRREHA